MKDIDTHRLSTMYGAIKGEVVLSPTLILESSGSDLLLAEGLVSVLGMNSARLLMNLVKNEIPRAGEGAEQKAEQVLAHIQKTIQDRTVQGVLRDYADIKATSRAKALYTMLAEF